MAVQIQDVNACLAGGPACDRFRGFLAIEQRRSLLECAVLGFDDKKVEESELKGQQDNIDDLATRYSDLRLTRSKDETNVIFPPQNVQGNRIDILIEDKRQGDDEAEDREAFGTKWVG
jgi:hypothetical protein